MTNQPLAPQPIYKQVIWGGRNLETLLGRNLPGDAPIGESWEVSDIEEDSSRITNGTTSDVTLRQAIQQAPENVLGAGAQVSDRFPLLVKYLDAQQLLSVQVHPDDTYAAQHENGSPGKTEMWLVLHAEPGAEMIAGLVPGTTREQFIDALQAGKIEQTLRKHKVKAGDVLLMPAGRVHALGSGLIVLEIQQTSTITYRLHDWGRLGADGSPRELHIEKALDVIDFDDTADPLLKPVEREETWGTRSLLAATRYFVTELWDIQSSATDTTTTDSPDVIMCIEGKSLLSWDGGEELIKPGDTRILPSALGTYELSARSGSAKLVRARVPADKPLADWASGDPSHDKKLLALCDSWVASSLSGG